MWTTFTKLFPTTPRAKTEILEEMAPVNVVVDTPSFDADQAVGRDFNIVLAVQEHAPTRLKEIDKLIRDHEQSVHRLKHESNQLRRLLTAINVKKNPTK
jgi:hypothetical protein